MTLLKTQVNIILNWVLKKRCVLRVSSSSRQPLRPAATPKKIRPRELATSPARCSRLR